MVASAVSMYPSIFALFRETTPGTGPANAAAWAAAEGTSAYRLWHLSVEPDDIVESVVEDQRLSDRIFKHPNLKPIKSLRNGEFPATLVLHGSGSTTADTNQVSLSGLMWVLEACLGGLSRGYRSAISAVASDTQMTLATATGLDEGQMYALEDADAAGTLVPVRALTLPGAGEMTTDMEPGFTVTTSDVAHAVAVAYIDQDAISNPGDGSAIHLSAYIQKGSHIWEANGGTIELESFEFGRGDVPKFNVKVRFAYCKVPGDGAPSAVTWTGTIQGDAGTAIGIKHKLHVQAKGTATLNTYDAVSVKLTPGVPRPRRNTVTENTSNMQGTAGYGTEPAPTVLEVQAFIDTQFQDWHDAGTSLVVKWYYPGSNGNGWVIQGSDCVLMAAPKRIGGEGSNLYTLQFEMREDRSLDALASNLDRARSKLLIGMF